MKFEDYNEGCPWRWIGDCEGHYICNATAWYDKERDHYRSTCSEKHCAIYYFIRRMKTEEDNE